jgi:hypothetical protein
LSRTDECISLLPFLAFVALGSWRYTTATYWLFNG